MSHRVTVQTDMTDKSIAIQALQSAKLSFADEGDVLRVRNGGGRMDYTINLKTGTIAGDTDYHGEEELGMLRQHYALAKFMKEATQQGVQVNSQFTDENGNVVLLCRTA